MASSSPDTVTALLVEVRDGGDRAVDELYEEIYTELRERAHGQRKQWRGEPTLQTTALAHEAYLKLVDQNEQSWESRSHFFAVASKAMRHILVDRARKQRAQKRGGEMQTLSLEALRESLQQEQATVEERSEMIMVLDAALGQFEKEHSRAARVVECRFFGGMTIEETAEALGVSGSTVSRDWDLAQAWLYREMKRIHGAGEVPEGDGDR
ncbi:RNA polymerase sigma factor (TIGR02999 family) [Salinibacter ruber]|jgi:RNA polymerase sigma factor (TIGR02999 family)|uniref:sigma-70 family RNA polymerase sigma factor n=1 Tax=Salinibacter ruber TaxID=146919 RepID=UPI00216A3E83|nr:sigma-70 family RNA polymerase sigma factor [Salinibacter ruber]MCS3666855.1 RNA polymerase sigma factor (TIGR02999 family) [Salinibacter ruber]